MPLNFPFTFSFNVPGLTNPFSSLYQPVQAPNSQPHDNPRNRAQSPGSNLEQEVNQRRCHPVSSPGPSQPLSRKRGWEPAFASPSQSATTLASTSGYLDTPAKYREMAAASPSASTSRDDFHEISYVDDATTELPSAKRRRGLAGSIVSTAVSAALIGTAVGLTVYRLWRDRGKAAEQLPPPPYQQGGWTPVEQQSQPQASQAIEAPLTTPRARKTRQPTSATKRSFAQAHTYSHRIRPRSRAQHVFSPPLVSTTKSQGLLSPPPPEFDFNPTDNTVPDPIEEQMDWIGDKLTMLIHEGQKALGREVVVMSEAKEDEVDDGSGAWVEEEPSQTVPPARPLSRSSSVRSRRPRPPPLFNSPPPSYSPPVISTASSAPYCTGQFHVGSAPSAGLLEPRTPPARMRHVRGGSVDGLGLSTSWKEDERAWESPELKEAMERARVRFGKNRNEGS